MSIELPFNPFPLLKGSYEQTVLGTMLLWPRNLESERKSVVLSDNDQLVYEVTTPKKWKKDRPTVVMIHGLCGSHRSTYLVRMGRKLKRKNVRAVRINLRGCGSGRGLAKKTYHGGQSDDIFEVIKDLKKDAPLSPIILIGFSLGGNLVIKLAGELEDMANKYLHMVVAINSPLDLYACVQRINQPDNRVYERYFIRLMKEEVNYRQNLFSDVPNITLPEEMSFMDFDELYTAPLFGFLNAKDYYQKCSAKNVISKITIPCHILFSKDDPLIEMCNFDSITLNDNVHIFLTEKGGHMGYLGTPGFGGFHWLDRQLLKWIFQYLK